MKSYNHYNVNPNQFIEVATPLSAYLLGLIWADGHVKNTPRCSPIRLSTTYPDATYFVSLFTQTGKWCVYTEKQKNHPTWKDRCIIYTNNRPLADFLVVNGYLAKSNDSACKILNQIPNNLKHYWVRGLFDGDGYIHTDSKGSHRLGISSTYKQDWKYMENICKTLGVDYSVHRKLIPAKKHASSEFVIYGMYRVIRFCNFMYDGFPSDEIGLYRKYGKLLQLKSTEEKNRYRGVCPHKNKWRAYTSGANNQTPKHLGIFSTKKEALEAVEVYYFTHPKCFLT
jgi:hypothetical protein